ncbi:MAG: calcineurin-like phosphoesterase C-terminal domain-containing protein [Acetobacteraceae bacterium]|nr:calcineurin-like phosphoesterase C-terminal domain-containing protein [Acetobacteraceae bacterium]
MGPEQGFSGDKPHQHHVLTAVSGSWWSGPYDVRGIPVALAGDGAPNGFHVLSIDGDRVTKRLVPAREPASAAMRIMLDSEFHQASEETYRDFRMGQLLRGPLPAEAVSSAFLLVNFFDGGPNSLVSFKIGDQAPQPMQRVQRPDPFVQEVYARNVSTKKPWVQPVPSTHLWQAQLPADLAPGMHRLTVRGTDAFGAEHAASMVLEIL